VHDAVRRIDIGGDDLGAVDKDVAARDPGRHVLAFDRGDHLHVVEVLGMHVARGHVIGENVHKLGLVLGLEQVGEDAGGQSSKRLVGRGEYGERTLSGERADKVGCLQRDDQGGQIGRGNDKVDDGLACRFRGGTRHENRINDVHDAVRRIDIGGDDLGAVDKDVAARDPGRHVLAFDRGDHLHVVEVLGMHVARGHVIGENIHELSLVLGLEQVVEGAGGQSSKRLVGRGEDGERALAGERADEVGCLQRGDQGGQIGRGNGEVDDGLRRQEHAVDDLHHAVPRPDVGGDDVGAINHDFTLVRRPAKVRLVHRHGLALDGPEFVTVFEGVMAHVVVFRDAHRVRLHVVGENVHKLGLVLGLEQVVKDAGG